MNRIATIAKDAEGFVYCVSSSWRYRNEKSDHYRYWSHGETGKSTDKIFHVQLDLEFPHRNRQRRWQIQADGVIVGSAIVKLCESYGADCVPYIKEYVKSMKDAIK